MLLLLFKGSAYWTCGDDGEWKGYPDMSLCTSDWIEVLERHVNNVNNTIFNYKNTSQILMYITLL